MDQGVEELTVDIVPPAADTLSPSIPQSVDNSQEVPVVVPETPVPQNLPSQPEPTQDTPRNLGGRPCEYCKRPNEVDKVAKDYLESAREAKRGRKPFIPYQQELADMLDIDNDTLYQWTIKKRAGTEELEHPGFAGLIKKLNTIKELLLLQRTTGRYNPTGAIFQLKTKHGYMETEKQILAGDQKTPLEIILTEERKLPDA